MPFQQMTCYLHHFLRVHCGVHCGAHCACTVRALSKHTRSACSSLLHPCEPWCCAVLAAVLPLLAPWQACLPTVGTPLWALVLCWLHSANACAVKKSLQHKPLSANLLGVLLMEEILHRRGHVWQCGMTSSPAPPVQCCVLKPCAPVQDFSHSTSLLLGRFFLPMLNGEHEGQDSKCVWWCRIFSINRLQKSCLLVFWLSCSAAWNACPICMYVCTYVCMYVCMYLCMYVSLYVCTYVRTEI